MENSKQSVQRCDNVHVTHTQLSKLKFSGRNQHMESKAYI